MKKLIKIIAAVLILVLMAGVLCGCVDPEKEETRKEKNLRMEFAKGGDGLYLEKIGFNGNEFAVSDQSSWSEEKQAQFKDVLDKITASFKEFAQAYARFTAKVMMQVELHRGIGGNGAALNWDESRPGVAKFKTDGGLDLAMRKLIGSLELRCLDTTHQTVHTFLTKVIPPTTSSLSAT